MPAYQIEASGASDIVNVVGEPHRDLKYRFVDNFDPAARGIAEQGVAVVPLPFVSHCALLWRVDISHSGIATTGFIISVLDIEPKQATNTDESGVQNTRIPAFAGTTMKC